MVYKYGLVPLIHENRNFRDALHAFQTITLILLSLPDIFKKLFPLPLFASHLYPPDWKYCFYLHFSQTVVMRTTISPLSNSVDTLFSLHLVQPVCDNWKWWILNLIWNCILLCFLGHWLLTFPLCCPLFVILLVGTHFSIYLVFMSQSSSHISSLFPLLSCRLDNFIHFLGSSNH